MKTTKKDFERFKGAFRWWQERLGLTDYRTDFFHGGLEPHEAGYCETDIENCVAKVSFAPACDNVPEKTGRHEALELLLAELWILGQYRWVRRDELEAARHRVIRRLENVFDGMEGEVK